MLNFLKLGLTSRKSAVYNAVTDFFETKVSKKIWTLYQLGKYRSAIQQHAHKISTKKALLALSASYAACGDYEKSKEMAKQYELLYENEIFDLIKALTPFYASHASELASKYKIENLLAATLFFHQQQYEQAYNLFNQIVLDDSNYEDYFLTKAYLHPENQQIVLKSINSVLQYFNLNQIALKEQQCQVSVNNISCRDLNTELKNSGLISILMTCYNAEKYLATSLESLLAQTYRYLEIVIVDDCSTDNTWKILEDFAKKDTRVRIYRQTMNAGTYVAKNRGLSLAKGEFVMCHDADDWSHPQRLEHQLKPLLANKSLICTTSNWIRISDDGALYTRSIFPISRLNPSSPLFRRRQVMEFLGGWDSVRIGADSEFLRRMRLQFGKKSIYKVKMPLCIGSHHQASLMNAPETGFSSQAMPEVRLAYWEAWSDWHIKCLSEKKSLYIRPFILKPERPYHAPQSILVNDDILKLYH